MASAHWATQPPGLVPQEESLEAPHWPDGPAPRGGDGSKWWRPERFLGYLREWCLSVWTQEQNRKAVERPPLDPQSPQAGGPGGASWEGHDWLGTAPPQGWGRPGASSPLRGAYVSGQVGQADLLTEHEAPPPAKLPALCRELRGMGRISASPCCAPDPAHLCFHSALRPISTPVRRTAPHRRECA